MKHRQRPATQVDPHAAPTQPVRVWDAPTRLFHWAIVILLAASWLTQELNAMRLHFLSGYSLAALLLFRAAWGVLGSETARFAAFVKSPLAGLRHLRRIARREPDAQIGHNAAGGWMVLAMLAALAMQVATGLCANDGGVVEGPLAKYVGGRLSDTLSAIHGWVFYVLLGLVALHLLSIAAYAALKGQDLLRPMITGHKRLPATARPPRMAGPWRAFAIAACAIAAVAWIARL